MLIRVFIHGKKWITHLVRLSPISSIAPIEILLCIYERIELHPTNIFQSHRAHIMVVWRILVIPPPLSPSDCPCFPSPPPPGSNPIVWRRDVCAVCQAEPPATYHPGSNVARGWPCSLYPLLSSSVNKRSGTEHTHNCLSYVHC